MRALPLGIEHPLDVKIECPHDSDARMQICGVKKALPDSRQALGVG